jgi:hypothetical protein
MEEIFLLNIRGVNNMGQTQIQVHTAAPSSFGAEIAIEKLKSSKSPGTGQFPAECIQAGGGTVCFQSYNLLISQ